MKDYQIAILLATYNGEKYLTEQIDSILSQTCHDWHLYIHDDGSKDSTMTIILDYVNRYPNSVTLLDYPSQGGASKNFLSMLERIEAPYYMFCDQDDVWLPEKIKTSFDKILEIEKIHSSNTPIIVNTDLTIVDEHLETVCSSFWSQERICPTWLKTFNDHAAIYSATGCTMLFNHRTKEIVKHPFLYATMHDAWVNLSVAAVNGPICYLPVSHILYRQHSHNIQGARDSNTFTIGYRLKNILKIIGINIRHYQEMNSIKRISIGCFVLAKIRYKWYIRKNRFTDRTNEMFR